MLTVLIKEKCVRYRQLSGLIDSLYIYGILFDSARDTYILLGKSLPTN